MVPGNSFRQHFVINSCSDIDLQFQQSCAAAALPAAGRRNFPEATFPACARLFRRKQIMCSCDILRRTKNGKCQAENEVDAGNPACRDVDTEECAGRCLRTIKTRGKNKFSSRLKLRGCGPRNSGPLTKLRAYAFFSRCLFSLLLFFLAIDNFPFNPATCELGEELGIISFLKLRLVIITFFFQTFFCCIILKKFLRARAR